MQVLFIQLRDFLHAFCPAAKKFFRYGLPTACGIFCSGLVCRVLLGTLGNFDKMLRVSNELLLCGKEMLCAVLFSALVLQLLHMAYVYQYGDETQK